MQIRGRRVAFALAGVAVLPLVIGGMYLWHNLVFMGETRPIEGTPHHFVIQQGVTEQDLVLVSEGLRLSEQFFTTQLGHGMTNPIEVRMAHTSPCIPYLSLTNSPTGVADKRMICINTVGDTWTKTVPQDRLVGLSIIAHEHFHNWQAQFNCLPGPNKHEYAWWVEGSATYVGLHTLVAAGMMSEDDVRERMRQWGGFSDKLEPLASYERRISGDAAYALAYRAIADLVRRGDGEESIYRFCEQVGRGVAWRTAFENAYGTPVEHFYADFERMRLQSAPSH